MTEEMAHSAQTDQERASETPQAFRGELVAVAATAPTGLGGPGLPAEERVAQAFLVRHPPGTRAVYARALRRWAAWCAARKLAPLEARREHVELWLREQKEPSVGTAAAASTRAGRLAAAQAAVTAPARPSGPPEERRRARLWRAHRDQLLACLLLLNGLRISEALALDLEDLGTMRSHRVARVRRKGGRHQDIVLAPRTAGVLDDYLEARGDAPTSGPLLVTRSGERLDRWAAGKVIHRLAGAAKIAHPVYPHAPAPRLRHRRPRRRRPPPPRPGRRRSPRSPDHPPL
jgi:integrase